MKVDKKILASIDEILLRFFKDPKIILNISEIQNAKELIQLEIVIPIANQPNVLRLNTLSEVLNKRIYEICKVRIQETKIECIEDVDLVIERFVQIMKDENNIQSNNPYRKLTNGFYGFLLNLLKESGFNVYAFASEKIKSDTLDRYNIDFEKGFICHLLMANYSVSEVYDFGQICASSSNQVVYRDLITEIMNRPHDFGYALYNYGNTIKDFELSEFQLKLITCQYDCHPEEIFEKISCILDYDIVNGLRLLASCQLKVNHLDMAICIANKYNEDSTVRAHLNNLYFNLASNPNANENQRKSTYNLWSQLLHVSLPEFCIQIINNISLIDNKHDEIYRYNILIEYLNKTGNFSVINSFFTNFKNPDYAFKLLADQYQLLKGRKTHLIRGMSSTIRHFFNVAPEESEKIILNFFNPAYNLNSLPIELIMLDFSNPFTVDLLKIDREEIQLEAIKKFFYVSYNFESILPILLNLRKSPFSEVVKSLQYHLAVLAYESYGQLLVDWIENLLSKEKGLKSFMKPIKQAALEHENELKVKLTIKDVNPFYHQKSLLDLYTDLAHESQTRAMQDSRKNPGFLTSFFKNTSIVRGNSFKHGRMDEAVIPLGTVSVSSTIDSRLYKNSDLFEFEQKSNY